MNVKILKVETQELVDAIIRKGELRELPSLQEGWRFNFPKHAKQTNCRAYVLVCDEHPTIIEGCIIFEMKDKVQPYLAYLEIAPHNQGEKRYDYVAGCLIAYAYKLSLLQAKGDYKGMLMFEVREKKSADRIKLTALYCSKYNAKVWNDKLVIMDEAGDDLVERYLT